MSCLALTTLLLLVAAYLLYVGGLFSIACGHAYKKTQESTGTGRGFTLVFTEDRYDFDCNMLWQTQVPALELLKSAQPAGLSTARMRGLYRDFSRSYPELCDALSFSDWIAWLQNADIAIPHGDFITITERGLLVLEDLEVIHITNRW